MCGSDSQGEDANGPGLEPTYLTLQTECPCDDPSYSQPPKWPWESDNAPFSESQCAESSLYWAAKVSKWTLPQISCDLRKGTNTIFVLDKGTTAWGSVGSAS